MRSTVVTLVGLGLLAALALADLQPGIGIIRVYYSSGWQQPHFYYKTGKGDWVAKPGPSMKHNDNATFGDFQWVITVAANDATFVLNDGGNSWDNNGGHNFVATTPGIYTLKAYAQLQTVQTFASGCPLGCSGHGSCSADFKCTCEGEYSGAACSCAPGTCGAHGKCDEDGSCACVAPWASCSGNSSCGTDVSADADNCGQCGAVCKPTAAGVESAKCSESACHIECKTGYTHCVDTVSKKESCHEGATCPIPPLPGCATFAENRCSGNTIDTDAKYEKNFWFTPRPGDEDYREDFGDYWRLVGHTHLEYDSGRTSVKVQVIAQHKDNAKLTYEFAGEKQDADTKLFTSATAGPITVRVLGDDGAVLKLQDVDFFWDAPKVDRKDGDFRHGQKGAIVELFGWPHSEIEQECQSLAQMGWAGVKVFPMQEQVMSLQPFNNIMNPWYFMYQPVSYRFEGRMGGINELRSMIRACRKYGVRVYADAVVNHMIGSGNDANPHHRNGQGGGCTYWPNKNSSATPISPFYSQGFTYTYNDHTGNFPLQEFPAVPYGPLDFHCERELNSWDSALILNAGWLTGLVDLHTGRENVRERIADYMTSILSIGFSGFRVDAAKHICPDDLVAIFSKLRRNMGGNLPEDFFTWLEILTGGEAGLLLQNENSGYNYGKYMEKKLLANGFDGNDVNKIKIWLCGYPNEPGNDGGQVSKVREVIQNDDADQQNPGSSSRDMMGQGSVFIKTGDVAQHRGFEVKLFTNPNGASDNNNDYPIRLVLSSYFWGDNGNSQGVPDGKSDCSLCAYTCEGCHGMPYTKAHDPNSCGYDKEVYTRVHRDKAIVNAMRGWMKMGSQLSNEELGLHERC